MGGLSDYIHSQLSFLVLHHPLLDPWPAVPQGFRLPDPITTSSDQSIDHYQATTIVHRSVQLVSVTNSVTNKRWEAGLMAYRRVDYLKLVGLS